MTIDQSNAPVNLCGVFGSIEMDHTSGDFPNKVHHIPRPFHNRTFGYFPFHCSFTNVTVSPSYFIRFNSFAMSCMNLLNGLL